MLTIPNLVSILRILLVPVLIYLLLEERLFAAGWLLGFIGATDWIDGYLARRLDQVSELGKALDPVADRLAVAAALIFGLIVGGLPAWFAIAILAREVFMSLATLYLWMRVRDTIAVRQLGKAATFGLYMAIPWFLIGEGADLGWVTAAAWIVGIPALAFYYAVVPAYLSDIRQRLAPG